MRGRAWVLIVAVVGLVAAGGCGGLAKKAGKAGSQTVGPSQTERRKAELLKRIEHKFDEAKVHYELARLYQADGLWPKAEYEYNLAMSFNPVYWEAQAATVKVLQQQGAKDKAETYADMRTKQVAGSAQSSFLLGKAFQAEALDRCAVACYEQALARAPDSAVVHKQLGFYYLSIGDHAKAKEYLKRSFELNCYQPDVAGQLGRLGVVVQTRLQKKGSAEARRLDKNISRTQKPQ